MKLAIVIPCYNEEEILQQTNAVLLEYLAGLQDKGMISRDSCIYYVDDGSRDRTWEIILEASRASGNVRGIRLSGNTGHQNALLAGLMSAEGDAILTIDADLQDDVQIIGEMLEQHVSHGAEIVYGVRRRRDTDTAFKRVTAEAFYRLMRVMGVNIIHNHADFRLMGRRSVEALRDYPEVNLFLRGIVPLIGYSSAQVYYNRASRQAGTSKYRLGRMFAFALDGITSFSITPLRLITALGFIIFLISAVMSAWVLVSALVSRNTVPGWASTVLPIYFIGGIQLLCIGILGEYTGKIYSEVKRRPRYIIREKTWEP